jgi:hypothetical protein
VSKGLVGLAFLAWANPCTHWALFFADAKEAVAGFSPHHHLPNQPPPEKTKSPRAPSLPTTQERRQGQQQREQGVGLARTILRPSLDGEGEQRLQTMACSYWFAQCCPGARCAVMRIQRAARRLGRQVSSTSLLLHTPTRVHFCRIFSSLVRLLPSPFHLGAPWTTAIPRLTTEGWVKCPTRLCTPS